MMNRETLLLELLENDDPNLREIYLSNFSVEEPTDSVLIRIMDLARRDPARRVREAALKVLARFWPRSSIVQLYKILVRESDVETTAAAVKSLNGWDDQLSYQLLCDLYQKRRDFQIKAAVLVGLGRRPFPQVQEFLIDYMVRDQDEFIRAMAVTTLGRCGDEAVIPILVEALRDPDHRVRANAVEGLARFAQHVDDSVFLDALEDSHHRVQVAGLKALHKLGWAGVPTKIDEMMANPADIVRASVNHFLQEVEGLISVSQDDGEPVVIN